VQPHCNGGERGRRPPPERPVAALWDTGHEQEAQRAGSRARHAIERLAEETLPHALRARGARCMYRPSPPGARVPRPVVLRPPRSRRTALGDAIEASRTARRGPV